MTRCGCADSTTFLLGSAANADAQNANMSTTLAQRTDEPHRRLNLFSIRMQYRDSVSNFAQAYLEAIQSWRRDRDTRAQERFQRVVISARAAVISVTSPVFLRSRPWYIFVL
jgi:hypothetical protein